MKRFVLDILGIIRPFGLKRVVFMVLVLLAQALAQLAAVFSLLPFLQAAADVDSFRSSALGSVIADLTGGGSDNKLIAATGALALTMLVIGNLVSLYADYSRARYAHQVGHWLRIRLVRGLLVRRYEYFLNTSSSLLLKNLVEDVSVFSQGVLGPLLDVLARMALTLLLLAALFVMEPMVFGCAVVFVVIYYIAVIAPLRRRASRASSDIQDAVRGLYFQVNELLMGIKPILAGNRCAHFIKANEAASAKVARIMPRIPLYAAVPKSGLEIVVFGGLIVWVLLAIAVGRNIVELMPTVGLIAVIAYRLMPSLQLIFAQSMTIAGQRQAMDEVVHFLRDQVDRFGPDGDSEASANGLVKPLAWAKEIRFNNVGFTYSGADAPAIHETSFVVRKGERVAFVGETGSGKSTLIDLIIGLLQPQSGRILIDGEPLTQARLAEWRQAVGYVPQELFLIDGTIAENIAFGSQNGSLDMDRIMDVAEKAQARTFVERQGGKGFEAVVGERGVRLSGGQRQRLALARALFTRPNVLVLDEATSALDPGTERRVVEHLSCSEDEITIISVTHRLSTVREYDRIYFIEHGRIVAGGTYDELRESHAGFMQFTHHA